MAAEARRSERARAGGRERERAAAAAAAVAIAKKESGGEHDNDPALTRFRPAIVGACKALSHAHARRPEGRPPLVHPVARQLRQRPRPRRKLWTRKLALPTTCSPFCPRGPRLERAQASSLPAPNHDGAFPAPKSCRRPPNARSRCIAHARLSPGRRKRAWDALTSGNNSERASVCATSGAA